MSASTNKLTLSKFKDPKINSCGTVLQYSTVLTVCVALPISVKPDVPLKKF